MLTSKPSTVVTVSGKKVPRDKARQIGGKYYERGVDVFYLENTNGNKQWYKVEGGKIAQNQSTGEWDLITRLEKNPELVRGIIDNPNEIVFFKKDLYKNVLLLDSLKSSPHDCTFCIDRQHAEKLGYIECIFNEFWYKKSNLTHAELKSIGTRMKVNYANKALDYNANNQNKTYLSALKAYDSYKSKIEIEQSTKDIAPYLDRFSFGVEFESSTGTVPGHILDCLGILPLRDGSVAGYEYTTVPLAGEIGLQTLKLACIELSRRCLVDHKCSMHIHVGNVKKEKLFLLAFWMMCYKIQNEMFELFPEYKKDQVLHLNSKKNYCEHLPNLGFGHNKLYSKENEDFDGTLNTLFGKIFHFLSGGYNEDDHYNFNSFKHPQDENGKQKWNRTSRYRWINLIPTVFDKSKTIELRLHTPTFNFTKVSNWLFLFVAMIRFCEKHKEEIISRKFEDKDLQDYTLEKIVEGYENNFGLGNKTKRGKDIAKYLKAYIVDRKKTFSDAWLKRKDALCNFELNEDATYKFEFEDIKTLY